MVRLLRLVLLMAALVSLGNQVCRAASGEKGAFDAAAQAFQDGFYSRAETEFAAFAERFTNSTRLPEAVLGQAKARLMQTNYNGALELLSSGLEKAGKLLDEYSFWTAEAWLRKGDLPKAADLFAEFTRVYPGSPRRIEAAVSEATARSTLGDWTKVVSLLQDTNGVFRAATRSNRVDEFTVRGYLLLGEAEFAGHNYPAAHEALSAIKNAKLSPRQAWQEQYLTCRLDNAEGRLQEALTGTTNLIALAAATSDRPLVAETTAFQAGLLERLSRPDEALNVYEKNLAESVPPNFQRQALLKTAELSLARNRIAKAAQVLESFCAQHRTAPARDLGLVTLGELRLRQHLAEPATNAPPAVGTNAVPSTNYLQQAVAAFETYIKEFPQGNLIGKAQLNLGWCYWLQEKFAEARAAFQFAATALPHSEDHALALFKLGDTLSRLGDNRGAVTNYLALTAGYAGDPAVRTNLFEPVLYQCVRAAVDAGDLAAATNALAQLLTSFPAGFHTDRATLLTGQAVTRAGSPEVARRILLEFSKLAPDSPLLPEVRLAIARTWEKESDWTNAISEYDQWLARFTNSPTGRARAQYFRAYANFRANRQEVAFQQFTNFVAQFPQDECTPLARWWVADYFFRSGRFPEAEENFQLLYLSTNAMQSDLAYQARLMAGRTAVARRGWNDAMAYFTNLTSDVKCPPDIWAQAMFSYGHVLMSKEGTNKLADYTDAISVFNSIYQRYPTNSIAVLALGEKAGCLLQWAQSFPQYEMAAAEFHKVITNHLADATARSIARVGLGSVLEKQAQQKTGADQQALMREALNAYLDTLYFEKDLREGEQPDLYWVKRGGLEAGRLTEALQEWAQAVKVYARLSTLIPAMKPSFEKRLAKAQENLAKARS